MKLVTGVVALTASLVLADSALAEDHKWYHAVDRLVDAWNAHDVDALGTRWTADATVTDGRSRVARGRAAASRLLAGSGSTIRLASAPIVQRLKDGSELVDVDVQIGSTVRHLRLVLVWGPDLPGGHHPDGRLFISSLTIEPARRPLQAWLFDRVRR